MPVQHRLEKVSLCVLFGLLCGLWQYRVTHHVFESFIGYTYLHKITVERILYSAFARTTDNTALTNGNTADGHRQAKQEVKRRSVLVVRLLSDKIVFYSRTKSCGVSLFSHKKNMSVYN
jgi:hypothetical protein